jgi:Fe-S-cluster containining protein
MQINCQEFGCMACCRHYWITVLPAEAGKIAESLGEKPFRFIEKRCLLQLQLYPFDKKTSNPLVIPSQRIPKKFLRKIGKELGFSPPFFLALPTIVFKRAKNGSCEFLNQKNGLCGIYENRPEQCKLFPFIPWNNKSLHSLYPFCAFLQGKKSSGRYSRYGKKHYQKVAAYFSRIEKNGFQSVWKTVPKKGILRLDQKTIGRISKKQFFSLLEPDSIAANTTM